MANNFRSDPANVAADPDGWAPLDDEWEYTAIPLLDTSQHLSDGVTPICAQLTYAGCRSACERLGLEMLTADDLEALHALAASGECIELPAFTNTPTAETSLAERIKSDEGNRKNLAKAGYQPGMRVTGFGKEWIAGAPTGRAWLMGWFVPRVEAYGITSRKGPGFVQPRPAPGSQGAHGENDQADDGTNSRGKRKRNGVSMTNQYIERVNTPATLREIRDAIADAWPAGTDAGVNILTAQVGIETADGAKLVLFNLGNARPRAGENWTSFRTHEVINGVSTVVDKSKFAAYGSLAAGAAAFVDLMTVRFGAATALAQTGDAIAFALKLGAMGYFTADAGKYADALRLRLVTVQKLGPVRTENPLLAAAQAAAGWLRGAWPLSALGGHVLAASPSSQPGGHVLQTVPPHGWRCSVSESIADAKANGKWHPRGSDYKPKRGDVICGARAGEEPEHGGRGHYETICAIEDGHDPTTIGGNENNRYEVAVYRWDNPAFRGVIEVEERLGALAVDLALEEKRKGVQEIPGAQHHQQIQAYHAGARRKGSSLAGMPGHETEGVQVLGSKAPDETDWCASSGGWRLYQAALVLRASDTAT